MLQFLLTNEFYFIFSILIIFLFCVHFSIASKYQLYSLHPLLVFSSAIILFFYLLVVSVGFSSAQFTFSGLMYLDSANLLVQLIIGFISTLLIFLSSSLSKYERINSSEFYLLFLVAVLGLFFLVSFTDLIGLYICIELVGMCSYLLATLNKKNVYSNEAALKYFVLGSISSNFILFGFSFVYVSTGLTNLLEISKLIACYLLDYANVIYFFENSTVIVHLLFAFFFVFIGLFFKMYAAPFHFWIPDIYNGSTLFVTAFISTLPLVPFVSLLLRLLWCISLTSQVWSYLFLFFACCSVILGAVGALFQSKIKRLLAFSAITHIGYFFMFIYLFLQLNQHSIYYVQLLFTYIMLYLVTTLGIFCVLVNLYSHIRGSSMYLNELHSLRKLYRSNRLLCLILVVFFFSLAGLPPLPGFIGKLFLFTSILSSGSKMLLFYIVVFIAVLSCFYYLRLVKLLYFGDAVHWGYFPIITYSSSVIVVIVFLFVSHFFLFSEYVNVFSLYTSLVFVQ